jgi:hydrogenase maturation factor
MCLGELARVRSVGPAGSLVVDSESRTSVVSDMLLEQSPTVGEWVFTHSGFALAIVGDAEAREVLAIRATLRKEPG